MLLFLLVCFLFSFSGIAALVNNAFCDSIFANSTNPAVSAECKKQMSVVCSNPNLLLRLLDASSKYPYAGMAYKTARDYGNYPECIETEFSNNEGTILGKYCPMSIGMPNPFSNLTDNKGLIPSYTTLSICIPDGCQPMDIAGLFSFLPSGIFIDGVGSRCMTKNTNSHFSTGSIVCLCVFGVIILIALISTAYDIFLHLSEKKSKHPVLIAFSILTNTKRLITLPPKTADQITCLNGLRFISMMWVIAGHGFAGWQEVDVVNHYAVNYQWTHKFGSEYILSAPIAVDTFFFMSGLLLSYNFLKSAPKFTLGQQLLGVPKMILHRYLRLTPALAAIFFVTITFYKNMAMGPLWPNVIPVLVDPCKKYWWSFFFYFQNYYNPDNMCLNQTWYLSSDMQMFVLSPIVIIPMALLVKKHFKGVIYSLLGLAIFCTALSIGIEFAVPHNNDYEAHTRFNDYLIGIALGAILREKKDTKFPFTRITNFLLWVLTLAVCLGFNIYYHDVVVDPENHTKHTLFYNLYRPVWSGSLAWMVYSSFYGYGGFINYFLSLPFFQIGARLTYSMYVLHGSVVAYKLGSLKTELYFSDFDEFYVFCGHLIVTMTLAYVWTLLFESPIIILEKWIFGEYRKKPTKDSSKN